MVKKELTFAVCLTIFRHKAYPFGLICEMSFSMLLAVYVMSLCVCLLFMCQIYNHLLHLCKLSARKFVSPLQFLDHALVLAGAVARLLPCAEGPVEYLIHSFRLGAVEPALLDGWQQTLEGGYILRSHLHVATGKHGVQFRAALIAPAVLHYGVDELINSRRLRQLCDLVAEPLGFVF